MTSHREISSTPSIGVQSEKLRSGESSASQNVESSINSCDHHKKLNIFITEVPDRAREQAALADSTRISRKEPRPLEGITFAAKDNYCTNGVLTTAGSKILNNFVPNYESAVTQKLLDAGAILVGKANLDEFAMGSSTENSAFGPTINPAGARLGIDNLVAGGSSGGSAAAVAAGIVPFAMGTDTGGSVRQPASLCGVVGFKPTYGVCSRWGIIAYGSSLDQAGVLANSVADVATVMDVIAGEDERDATSALGRTYNFDSVSLKSVGETSSTGKIRIGLPKQLMQGAQAGFTGSEIADGSTNGSSSGGDDVARIWDAAQNCGKDIGAEIVEVSLPNITSALPAYYIIALAEASSNLARYDGIRYGKRSLEPDSGFQDIEDLYMRTRAEGFGIEVKRRIIMGAFALSTGYYDAYYLQAAKVRRMIVENFAAAFAHCDVIATPTTPSSAFAIGAHNNDPLAMYLEDLYTVPVNLAGLPAISIPASTSANGMPLGLQLIAPSFHDEKLLSIAQAMEQSLRAN